MKTGVKKKKIPKCPAGCQSLPQKSGFSIPLQLRKIKSHPPFWSAPPTVNYTRKTIHHPSSSSSSGLSELSTILVIFAKYLIMIMMIVMIIIIKLIELKIETNEKKNSYKKH